jgi:hypothetical protein
LDGTSECVVHCYIRAALKTYLILSFGEEFKGEVNKNARFLEMPISKPNLFKPFKPTFQ